MANNTTSLSPIVIECDGGIVRTVHIEGEARDVIIVDYDDAGTDDGTVNVPTHRGTNPAFIIRDHTECDPTILSWAIDNF